MTEIKEAERLEIILSLGNNHGEITAFVKDSREDIYAVLADLEEKGFIRKGY